MSILLMEPQKLIEDGDRICDQQEVLADLLTEHGHDVIIGSFADLWEYGDGKTGRLSDKIKLPKIDAIVMNLFWNIYVTKHGEVLEPEEFVRQLRQLPAFVDTPIFLHSERRVTAEKLQQFRELGVTFIDTGIWGQTDFKDALIAKVFVYTLISAQERVSVQELQPLHKVVAAHVNTKVQAGTTFENIVVPTVCAAIPPVPEACSIMNVRDFRRPSSLAIRLRSRFLRLGRQLSSPFHRHPRQPQQNRFWPRQNQSPARLDFRL